MFRNNEIPRRAHYRAQYHCITRNNEGTFFQLTRILAAIELHLDARRTRILLLFLSTSANNDVPNEPAVQLIPPKLMTVGHANLGNFLLSSLFWLSIESDDSSCWEQESNLLCCGSFIPLQLHSITRI
jgi:hypothetical protein